MVSSVLLDIIAPILVLIGLGAVMRWKFKVDLGTLSKLNLYLFSPAFIFYHVSTSTLAWSAMGGIVAITLVQVITLGILMGAIGKVTGMNRKTLAAVAIAVMFYNSGNYGLPLAELAFPKDMPGSMGRDGGAVQAFVMLTQNVLGYTLGLMIAAWAGSGGIRDSVVRVFRMPVIYMLAAALLARMWTQAGHELPIMIKVPARYLSDGLIGVALITLGAQLASNPRWPRWKPVSLVLVLRLIFGPIQMAALLYGFHLLKVPVLDLWPWPAALLILTAGVPTAITNLLLTLELNGDADLAADCVFWTTVFSSATIAGWLIVIRAWGP